MRTDTVRHFHRRGDELLNRIVPMNLRFIDAATGEPYWPHHLYRIEVNGNHWILRPATDVLDDHTQE